MSRLKAHLAVLSGAASNIAAGRNAGLVYVVDKENWAVRAVGTALARNLTAQLPVHLTTTAIGARNQLIHFGSIDMYMTANGWRRAHASNKIIVTVFHLSPIYRQTHLLAPAFEDAVVHTTNTLTQEQLISAGVPAENIHIIPLGVDTKLFRKAIGQRDAVRKRLNIDPKARVIGSFQKDGVGWGGGLEPKLIKGPDTLAETMSKISEKTPVHVLLAGPARGYVIEQLKAKNIPYTYTGYHQTSEKLAELYQALDLYLITSRVEGGPLQILEAWAAGVPLVATPVGMIRDIAEHGRNCFIAPVEDPRQLAEAALQLLSDNDAAAQISEQAKQDAENYDWSRIAARYLAELYQPQPIPV
jgi:glycosyltransferase involved in cell wall biosynthesis